MRVFVFGNGGSGVTQGQLAWLSLRVLRTKFESGLLAQEVSEGLLHDLATDDGD
jgi:hypothetical protein